MNLRIEIRYAVLLSLLVLLWLSIEFMIGLQDKFLSWHPIVTPFFAIVIPVFCIWKALGEITDLQNGKITFRQAFFAGFIIAVFAAVLAIPVQLIFHFFINPEFFNTLIDYSVANHFYRTPQEAEAYFNLKLYLVQATVGTLVVGIIVSLALGWRMRTVK